MKIMILCFSGKRGSGKTSIAKKIAEQNRLSYASFGNFVRSIAVERSIPLETPDLQNLGEQLIVELGWDDFCKRVIQSSGWTEKLPLVVDGVRHLETFESFKRIQNHKCLLISIKLEENIRNERLEKRDGFTQEEIKKLDEHSTEIQVSNILLKKSDLVVDGIDSTKAINTIIEYLKVTYKLNLV